MAERRDALELTWPQVHGFRLRRHRLDGRGRRRDLVAVVRDVIAVQSQVASAAALSLRARVEGLAPEDVDGALWTDRTLVKTWSIRRTLHLLPARDHALYTAALRPVAERERQWITRWMSPGDRDRLVDAIREALAAGRMTRKELTDRVAAVAGPKLRRWVATGWGGLPKLASLLGHVCQGPGEGQEVTFVLVEDWIRDGDPVPEAEAEDAFLRRYLASFGPATITDYAAWSGIPVREARAAWARVADDRIDVDVGGTTASALAADVSALAADPGRDESVRLLPSFDAYLLGHKDKAHLVGAAHYKRVYRKAGWLTPVVLVDGRIAGVWGHAKKGGGRRISVELFGKASRAIRGGIREEADDVGRFLGGGATVAYG